MRVGWVLSGGIEGNSAKSIGINIHDWLNKNGVESEILFSHDPGGIDVPDSTRIEEAIHDKEITHLVFQKVCIGKAPEYLRQAKKNGIITVYTVDDFMGQYSESMELEADIIVTNSKFMKEWVEKERKREATQIPCAYEVDRDFFKKDYHTEQIRVFWFGSLGNAQQAYDLQEVVRGMGYKYEILGPPSIATVPWKQTYYEDLINADIVVLPNLRPLTLNEQAKGDGRPVQAMILGIPIIVSPFPSYIDLIRNGVTGFVCYLNTVEEFRGYLEYLGNEKVREEIGQAGRERVIDEYSIDSIGKRWKETLTR